MKRIPVAFLGSWLVAACASQPPQVAIPEALVPAGERTVERVSARGVQIYQCRTGTAGAGASWVFVAPEAGLFDHEGRNVGKHYAGPHWEAADGSKIIGAVKTRADAPQTGAIPWLLMSAKSVGSEGRFAGITSVQRVNTGGGTSPSIKCDASNIGAIERVPYTADYVLLSARGHTAW